MSTKKVPAFSVEMRWLFIMQTILTGLRWLFYLALTILWILHGGWRPWHAEPAFLAVGAMILCLALFSRLAQWHWVVGRDEF